MRALNSRPCRRKVVHQSSFALILKSFVPQSGQTPWSAARPFFMVTSLGFFISTFFRSLTQYAWGICYLLLLLWPVWLASEIASLHCGAQAPAMLQPALAVGVPEMGHVSRSGPVPLHIE